MRKGLFLGLVVLFVLLFLKPVFAADKIAYVDVGKIFDEYAKTKDYDKNLEVKAQSFDKERETKDAELKQLEDKTKLLSDQEKDKKLKELDEKRKVAENDLIAKANELRKERNEKAKEILGDIEKSVSNYAKKEGYTMVFDVRSLVYNSGAADITEAVLRTLQGDYKKK